MATRRFLNSYMVQDKNGLTHTLLDGYKGGKVRIPDDKMNSFIVAYATDVQNGHTNYMNELRRAYFRMFLDLDIEWTQQLTTSEIEEVMYVVCETFKRFFPDNTSNDLFRCIVSDAVPKSICYDNHSLQALLEDQARIEDIVDSSLSSEDAVPVESMATKAWDCTYETVFKLQDGRLFKNTHRKEGLLKHGIHMNFPFIIVSSDDRGDKGCEALYMREALIVDLTKHFGGKFAPKGWANVVDNAVYVTSGMRMMYSHKTQVCNVCKGKKQKDCTNPVCENGKDLTEGRPYTFRFAGNDGKYDQNTTGILKNNLVKLLSYSMLYTSQCKTTEGWKKFTGCPSYGDIIKAKSTNGPPKLASRERVFNEDKKAMRTWKAKTAVTDTKVIEVFQRCIRTRFVKQYLNTRIRTVVRDDKRYYISVDGEGSNFCLNLNPPRDHNSNRIWFSAEYDGMRVRCFCTCLKTEGRHLGYCKDFKSPARPFNPIDLAILFPQKKQSTNPMFANTSTFMQNLHKDLFEDGPPVKRSKP